MGGTLVIKRSPLSDVVRTTALLRVLEGPVTWATGEAAVPLLRGIPQIERIVTDLSSLQTESFSRVISLDEEREAYLLATRQQNHGAQLIGSYMSARGSPAYTSSSSEWFDMSLISKYGKTEADQRKRFNRKSYQEILFGMIGLDFEGEEYLLPPCGFTGKAQGIGLEERVDDRHPDRAWPRFAELEKILTDNGKPFDRLNEGRTLEESMRDLAGKEIVVTTDSLTLHLALGLQKKVVAIFTSTSPWEIHGYGRLEKVVSPRLDVSSYSPQPTADSGAAVEPAEVYKRVVSLNGR